MTNLSTAELLHQLQQSDRPFAGHTRESLIRKIASPAVREEVKEQMREELEVRDRIELPVLATSRGA